MIFSCVSVSVGMNIINLKNEPSNGLNLISLFAGCGGSSLGYKSSGYDIRLAVEWDKSAVETYRDNFPGTPVFQGDIADLGVADAIKLSGVSPGELDVLDGSPPCQGFSGAGHRRYSDDRNQLFREYVRILKAYMPRAFIMENVSGLRKGKMKLMFAEMTKALKASGYRVICRELNAWWYGVPQSRRRLIWVGIREDLPFIPSHPFPAIKRPISVSQAFGSSIVGKIKSSVFQKQSGWLSTTKPAQTLLGSCSGVSIMEKKSASEKTTVRSLTIPEAKILQSFPEEFRVKSYKEIGNSVPPLMAEAVGKHVAEILNDA